jgi:hypothetical protein
MKVSFVSFGKHVRSHEFLRVQERYINFGTILDLDFDKSVLIVTVMKDGAKSPNKIAVPAANIASMDIIEDPKK